MPYQEVEDLLLILDIETREQAARQQQLERQRRQK
jgi:hypothetical protein